MRQAGIELPLDPGFLAQRLFRRSAMVGSAGLGLLLVERLPVVFQGFPSLVAAGLVGPASAMLCWWILWRWPRRARAPSPFTALLLLPDGRVEASGTDGSRVCVRVNEFHRAGGLIWLRAEAAARPLSLLSGRSLMDDRTWAAVTAWLVWSRRRRHPW